MNVFKSLFLLLFLLLVSISYSDDGNNVNVIEDKYYAVGPDVLVTAKALDITTHNLDDESYQRAYNYVSRKTNMPDSVIFMLHVMETNWGKSQLWKKHNNGFGIKGNSLGAEYNAYYRDDCGTSKCAFAGYNTIDASFEDLTRLLNKVYKDCKFLNTNDCIKCLKQKGYHTDNSVTTRIQIANKYVGKSIQKLERGDRSSQNS